MVGKSARIGGGARELDRRVQRGVGQEGEDRRCKRERFDCYAVLIKQRLFVSPLDVVAVQTTACCVAVVRSSKYTPSNNARSL